MSDVVTKLRLDGEDRMSGAIRSVRAAADDTAGSLKRAADGAGNFERGFKGIKDILGGAGGPFGALADKLGGVESILMGMPASLGPIALGAAAAGGAVAYWYAEQEKARLATLATAQAAVDASYKDKAALADRLGLSRELLGVANNVVDYIAAAAAKTEELAETEKKRLAAASEGNAELAEQLRYRGVVLQAELQTLDRQRATQDQRLQAEKDITAQQQMRRELQAGEYDQAERAAASLMTKTDRLNALGRAYHHQQLQIDQDRQALQKKSSANATEELQDRLALMKLGEKEHALGQKMLALAKEGEKPKGKSGGGGASAQAKQWAEEARRATAEGAKETNDLLKEQEEAKRQNAEFERGIADDNARWQQEAGRIAREEAGAMLDVQRQLQDATDRGVASMQAAATALGGKYGPAIAGAASAAANLAKNWKTMGGNGPGVAAAVGQVAASLVEGEREKAAIMALTEAAQAVASYPNVPAMVAHGAAAVMYGAAAAGLGGGSGASKSPAALSPAAAPSYAAGANAESGKGGAGGNVYHITYNGVFSTKSELAKGMKDTMRHIEGTGYEKMGAA